VLPANWQKIIRLNALIVVAASVSMTAATVASADDATPAVTSSQPGIPSGIQPGANTLDSSQANTNSPDIDGPVILGDGFVYQGGLRDGKPNGKGIKRWPTGEWVVGNFVQGRLEGDATIHNSDGGTLTGLFKANAPWDAIEKNADGNVVAQYNGGVMRPVTQVATAAASASPAQAVPAPTVQQVHLSVDVPKQ
jgi:hypothetical protein